MIERGQRSDPAGHQTKVIILVAYGAQLGVNLARSVWEKRISVPGVVDSFNGSRGYVKAPAREEANLPDEKMDLACSLACSSILV